MTRPVVTLPLYLRFACMNVPTKVGARAWRRCFDLLVEHGEFFGMNEAGSVRAKRIYNRRKDLYGYSQFGLFRGTNPIFWKKSEFSLVSGRQVKLHGRAKGRLALKYPGFNGARYLTEVILRPTADVAEVAVINVHLVAPGPKVNDQWRRQMRAKSIATINGIVAHHADSRRAVVLMGDTNIAGELDLPGVQWLYPRGVDKLGLALPDNATIATRTTKQFEAPTDHKHGRSADVQIRLKETAKPWQ